jgi:hypothetical protein
MNASASFSHHWQDLERCGPCVVYGFVDPGSSFGLYRRAKTEIQGPNHGVNVGEQTAHAKDHLADQMMPPRKIVESFSPFHGPTR